MDRPTTGPPTAGQAAAEQPGALTDEELQDVAAGADWEFNPNGFAPRHWRHDDWLGWGESGRPF